MVCAVGHGIVRVPVENVRHSKTDKSWTISVTRRQCNIYPSPSADESNTHTYIHTNIRKYVMRAITCTLCTKQCFPLQITLFYVETVFSMSMSCQSYRERDAHRHRKALRLVPGVLLPVPVDISYDRSHHIFVFKIKQYACYFY